MYSVECNGLKAWADSVRFFNLHSYWRTEVAMISMFGPRNAVRASWARFLQKKSSGVQVGDQTACLVEGVKYISIQTPMTRQMLHVVLLHPACTHQFTPFADNFIQVGPEPEIRYFSRLNRMCPIPFRPTWREPLWHLGIENELIVPLPGCGMPGYVIHTTGKWSEVVKSGIQNGVLV